MSAVSRARLVCERTPKIQRYSRQHPVSAAVNHGFEFEKRRYFSTRTHNETLSVAAIRVNRFGSFVFKLRKMLCLTDHRSLITYHLPRNWRLAQW